MFSFAYIGNPEPKVIWKKDNKEIKPKKKDKRFVISWDIDNDMNILEIKNAKVEDSGSYMIEATSPLGTIQETVTVTVEETVIVEETVKPEILVKPDDILVACGDVVKLSCKITG